MPDMPTSELDVLKPIDPSISHSDDYEIFTLSNAQVFSTRNGKPASLLAAYADTPLRVEGRLEAPDRSQMKYLLKKPFKPVDVKITGVTRFSYGQTQDGEIVIWALGEAGWFELRPARTYKELFQDMVEAVEILYFVTDVYNEPRKRGGGPNAQLIFQEYAEDERFPCNDPAQAARIFQKHRAFLIMCFLNRAQGIGWSNTPLYQHFRKQYPKDWEIARARIDGKYVEAEEAESRGRGKPKQAPREKPTGAPKKDDNWWEAGAIFEFMQKAVTHGAMHIGHITVDKVAKLLVKRYEVDEFETAKNVLLVHASNLCYIMDHPRRTNIQFFSHEPIYEELTAGHSLSAADIRRAQSVELRPRKDYSTLRDDATSKSDSSASIETPPRRPSRRKQGTLSVLRPKSSKYSGKGKGGKRGKGKGKVPSVIVDTGSESEEEGDVESDSDVPIDTPTQALSPGKRKHVPETADINPRKRAASASVEPEPDSAPPSSSSEEETEAPTEPLPLRWRSNNVAKSSSPALLPPVVSTPLPTYTANGPGDSWICTFDGCSRKVYGVSTDLGRKLVKEHFQDHASGRQREIGLVLSEEQRLRLPVNNLIKRIREMTEHQQPLFPSLGPSATAMRQPIERSV